MDIVSLRDSIILFRPKFSHTGVEGFGGKGII